MLFAWCPGYFDELHLDCLVGVSIRLGLVSGPLFPHHLIASPNGLSSTREISNVASSALKNKVKTALSLRWTTL